MFDVNLLYHVKRYNTECYVSIALLPNLLRSRLLNRDQLIQELFVLEFAVRSVFALDLELIRTGLLPILGKQIFRLGIALCLRVLSSLEAFPFRSRAQ